MNITSWAVELIFGQGLPDPSFIKEMSALTALIAIVAWVAYYVVPTGWKFHVKTVVVEFMRTRKIAKQNRAIARQNREHIRQLLKHHKIEHDEHNAEEHDDDDD